MKEAARQGPGDARHAAAAPRGRRSGLRLKVCGVTTVEDALAAIEAGADVLGLNFYAESPRFVDVARAAKIRRAVGRRAEVAGVFVNARDAEIDELVLHVGLDIVQLHGDFDLEQARRYGDRAFVALRSDSALESLLHGPRLEALSSAWGVLIDAPAAVGFGGAGIAWDWSVVKAVVTRAPSVRFWLAGGLRPKNVAAAVRQVSGLAGVDVCSGVERAPGRKDVAAMRAFAAALRGEPGETPDDA